MWGKTTKQRKSAVRRKAKVGPLEVAQRARREMLSITAGMRWSTGKPAQVTGRMHRK